MARAPQRELIRHRRDQRLGDALVPQIRADREWAEKADTAPVGGEIDAGECAVVVGGEGGGVLASEAAIDVVKIGPEIIEVGDAQEGTEGAPHDALPLRQVALLKWTNVEHFANPPAGMTCSDRSTRVPVWGPRE